jgi:hypothetical protein
MRLHLRLLGELQGVVDFDPEVSDRALQVGVPKEALNGPKIAGSPIDQRRFGAPQRMGAIGRRVQTNRPHPSPDDPGILTGRKMRDSDTRLGNRNCSGFRCAVAIQAATASRVCSVISNWTGR